MLVCYYLITIVSAAVSIRATRTGFFLYTFYKIHYIISVLGFFYVFFFSFIRFFFLNREKKRLLIYSDNTRVREVYFLRSGISSDTRIRSWFFWHSFFPLPIYRRVQGLEKLNSILSALVQVHQGITTVVY